MRRILDMYENLCDFLLAKADEAEGVTNRAAAWLLGFLESPTDVGITWIDPDSPRSIAYDRGRDLFRRIFSRFGVIER